jgi:hypothetical protein
VASASGTEKNGAVYYRYRYFVGPGGADIYSAVEPHRAALAPYIFDYRAYQFRVLMRVTDEQKRLFAERAWRNVTGHFRIGHKYIHRSTRIDVIFRLKTH